jgi:hypothetical protein
LPRSKKNSDVIAGPTPPAMKQDVKYASNAALALSIFAAKNQ